eukprot:363331-Chlamydomonas_euryale.AAC.3
MPATPSPCQPPRPPRPHASHPTIPTPGISGTCTCSGHLHLQRQLALALAAASCIITAHETCAVTMHICEQRDRLCRAVCAYKSLE